MGVHYVNGSLVGDNVLDPTRSEASSMRRIRPVGSSSPLYGIPAFYSLHAWIRDPNSDGLLKP